MTELEMARKALEDAMGIIEKQSIMISNLSKELDCEKKTTIAIIRSIHDAMSVYKSMSFLLKRVEYICRNPIKAFEHIVKK